MNEIITFHKPIVENCCRLFLTVARTSERFQVSEKNEELHSSRWVLLLRHLLLCNRWRHKGTHTSP